MEPENNITEASKNPLLKVTPLSKYLAMVLLVTLPFIGGWIGYTYAPEKIVTVDNVVVKEVIKEVIVDKPIPEEYRTFTSEEHGISISFPSTFEVSDGTEDFIHTVPNENRVTPDAEYFSFCDGLRLTEGHLVCDGPFYSFGIHLSDNVMTQELIDSWGGEVVSAEKVTINGRLAWSVTLCAATGCALTIKYDYKGGTLSIIFYNSFLDHSATPLFITEEAREILDTLRF